MTGEVASADSDDLYGPVNQKVNSNASVFPTYDLAAQALSDMTGLWSACRGEMEAAFTKVLRQSLAEAGADSFQSGLRVSFQEDREPGVGESSAMFRLSAAWSVDNQDSSLVIDFMAFRHGRMIGELVYTAVNPLPDYDLESTLARAAANKLDLAEASLPAG